MDKRKLYLFKSAGILIVLALAWGMPRTRAAARPLLLSGSPLAVGMEHSCALTRFGGVLCWGGNTAGQLGDATYFDRDLPAWVNGFAGSGAGGLSVGYLHSCALTPSEWTPSTGTGIKCWGWNYYGQLGINSRVFSEPSAAAVFGFETAGATALTLGEGHTCALTVAGGVKCWGNNVYGQLGDGTVISRTLPVDVYQLTSGMIGIGAGGFHTCAITTPGGVKCWGGNGDGQLGDSTNISSTIPVNVTGLISDVVSIAPGSFHTCALTGHGVVNCWGLNISGQLGDGTNDNRKAPVPVSGLGSGVVAVTSGAYHSCALLDTGGVVCWGLNNHGQLGDGTTTDSNTPLAVTGLSSGVMAVDAGASHTCAMLENWTVKCWGLNNDGQLGDGTHTESHAPVDVLGFPTHNLLFSIIVHW